MQPSSHMYSRYIFLLMFNTYMYMYHCVDVYSLQIPYYTVPVHCTCIWEDFLISKCVFILWYSSLM